MFPLLVIKDLLNGKHFIILSSNWNNKVLALPHWIVNLSNKVKLSSIVASSKFSSGNYKEIGHTEKEVAHFLGSKNILT